MTWPICKLGLSQALQEADVFCCETTLSCAQSLKRISIPGFCIYRNDMKRHSSSEARASAPCRAIDLGSLELLPLESRNSTRSQPSTEMAGARSSIDCKRDTADVTFTRRTDQHTSNPSAAPGSSMTGLTDTQLPDKEAMPSTPLDAQRSNTGGSEDCSGSSSSLEAFSTAAVPEVECLEDDVAAAVDQSAHQHRLSASAAGNGKHAATHQKAAELQKPKPRFKQGLGCPTGVRVFTDKGVDLDSRQNPLMEAFALVTMAIYLGMVHLLTLLLVASVFSRTALLIMIGVWCTLLLPAQLLWEPFLGNAVWRSWRRYFRFSVIMDQDMELHDTQYVIPEYPHGVFPLSQLIAISLTDIWPNHPIYSIAADSVFHIPLWKHVMTWIGALPATSSNFKKLLKKGSVGLIPGGIAEMFMVEDDREVIKLLDRKGFVRIAVEMGKPLLPCYHFGNSRLFKWGPKSWEQAARRHRIALGLLFGRWGLPFALPNRVPLMMIVGAPIPVKQTSPHDPNFAAVVDEAHAKLVDAMQQLYDKYKAEYGWADRPLVIK